MGIFNQHRGNKIGHDDDDDDDDDGDDDAFHKRTRFLDICVAEK